MKKTMTMFIIIAGIFGLVFMNEKALAVGNDYVQEMGGIGQINWTQGNIRSTGYGIRPEEVSHVGKAKLMAREAAISDAYRNMARIVSEVPVNSETYVKEHEEQSDEIWTSVKGLIKSARIVTEADLPDGIYEVTIEISMKGPEGLKGALKREPTISEFESQWGISETPQKSSTNSNINEIFIPKEGSQKEHPSSEIVYTGVIVDGRNTALEPCMSPRILFPDGSEIWGTFDVDPDFVINPGIASYHKTLGDAYANSRAGSNPLYIKASGVSGKTHSDVVLTEENGKMLLEANARGLFLQKFAVIFVIN